MARRLFVWTLIVLVSPLAWAETDYVASAPLRDAGLSKYWQLQLPLSAGQYVREAYLVDEQLYIGTQDGWVYAIDAPTGAIRWLQPVTREEYPLRRPCHSADTVIFVTPIDIQIYGLRGGEPLGRKALGFPAGTAAVCDGRLCFIGGLDSRLYAFDIESLWRHWRVLMDGPIRSAPAVFGRAVFCASDGHTVYSCSRVSKRFNWLSTTFGAITADVVATSRGVYIASQDHSLYLFDHESGQTRWQARLNAPLSEPPFVTTDTAFQYAFGQGVVAIETADAAAHDDRIRWTVPDGRTTLTVDDKYAYILTETNEVLVVRIDNGEVEYTIPTPGFSIGLPTTDDTMLLVASPGGQIFCARPVGVPYLSKQGVRDALRLEAPAVAEAVTEAAPTTQPAAATPRVPADAAQGGVPIGGKSKISKEYQRRSGTTQ